MGTRHRWSLATLVATAVALVASFGTFARAAGGIPAAADPKARAVAHLRAHRRSLGLTAADVGELVVSDGYTSTHNGVTHVYVQQQLRGIDVFSGLATVNVAKDGSIIAAPSRLVGNLAGVAGGQVLRRPAEAAAAAASRLGLHPTRPFETLSTRGDPARETVLGDGGVARGPITAKLVWLPLDGNRVRLAWSLEIEEISGEHWWNAFVDAESGELLARHDRIQHDDVRATAGALARPAGAAAASALPLASPNPVLDGSEYRVFAMPLESPSSGPRTLVENPADAIASPFGWHDTDGAPGAELTITWGNNVHAYTDVDANNKPDPGSEPDGHPSLNFDFPLDLTFNPDHYRPAAVTNLFYWNNVVHDVFYRYGFDEEAGNFQVNNYGRGGVGSDEVVAQAQDGGGVNNANFVTFTDGNNPRMQMYLWPYPFPNLVGIDLASPVDFRATYATFGPTLTTDGVAATAVVALDQADRAGRSTTDGCSALTNAAAVSGRIALVDRGGCAFEEKVYNAQKAKALAVIVVNDVPGEPIVMESSRPSQKITIPSVMIGLDQGGVVKASLPASIRLRRATNVAVDRDGDLDGGVIVHEYGHGISTRLASGPKNNSCLYNLEQMGEGWSDFFALALTAQPSDTSTMPRGVGTYVLFQPPDGVGIRPTPYSTDMAVNPSTYDTIKTAAIPHGVGYVWASMLWEVYWALVGHHGFNPDLYGAWSSGGNNLALQLVVDGLRFQPCFPGFVDGRDAILQADRALTNGANQCRLWTAFAKRGLGAGASQGSSKDTTDGTESFALPRECRGIGM